MQVTVGSADSAAGNSNHVRQMNHVDLLTKVTPLSYSQNRSQNSLLLLSQVASQPVYIVRIGGVCLPQSVR